MRKQDCFYLGKIVRKHSFKGEVVAKLDTDEPENYQNLESVFVEHGKNLIPFFIEKSLLQKGNQLRLKFETVDSEKDANSIVNNKLYLPLSLLPKLDGNKFYYHEIEGFTAVDTIEGEFGTVLGVNDSGAQPLFVIDYEGTEILIPMVDDFITKIDRDNKQLVLTTPPGLISMYLG